MKILRLEFENINNLKGHHMIDFEESPLREAGIFAITGPTGSGKSTILDIITLALFNRIPRFKSAISKSGINNLGAIITHNMRSAKALIKYEVHQKRFTSSWEINYNRNGNLKDHEMFIYDELGRVLDLKKSEVPNKNEELIGLNYEQFVKSIILSQGDFARFLKSDKHERGKLLEKITGTEIYRLIGSAAFNRKKELETKLQLLNERLKDFELLTEENSITYETELQQLEQKLVINKNQLLTVQNLLKYRINLDDNQKLSVQYHRQLTNILDKEQQLQKELNILSTHESVHPHKTDIELYENAKENLINSRIHLKTYAREKKEALLLLEETIGKMAELIGKPLDQQTFKKEMFSFEHKIKKLENEVENFKKRGRDKRAEINNFVLQYKLNIEADIKPIDAIKEIKKRTHTLSNKLHKAGLNRLFEPINIQELINQKSQTLTLLKDFQESDHIANKKRVQIRTSKLDLEQIEKVRLQSSQKIKVLKKELDKLDNEIIQLRIQEKDQILISKLSDHRLHLESGIPCPLCGSIHHDLDQFADRMYHKLEIVSKKIVSCEEQLKLCQTSLITEEKIYSSLIEQQEYKRAHLNQTEKELLSDSQKVDEIWSKLSKKIDLNNRKPKDFTDVIKKEITILTELTTAPALIQNYETLMALFDQLEIGMKAYKSASNELKKNYDRSVPIEDICNKLLDLFEQSKESIRKSNDAIKREKKDEKVALSLHENLTKKLQPIALQFGQDIETLRSLLIPENKVVEIKSNKQLIHDQKISAKTKIEQSKNLISQILKDHQNLAEQTELRNEIEVLDLKKNEMLERKGSITQVLQTNQHRKDQRKNLLKEIFKVESNFKTAHILDTIIGDKTGNKFSNFAQNLTLRNLLVFGNRRLQDISDRYLIDMPGENGDLQIIDQYQGGEKRSVATLSGGETFMISLALALSLSDLASQNIQINSLFIDEGFGTLDEASLNVAIDTLEKLQTEKQKTIGVISHVTELKERISVQIKLQKDVAGFSMIELH